MFCFLVLLLVLSCFVLAWLGLSCLALSCGVSLITKHSDVHLHMILDVSGNGNRSQMNKLETIENVSHGILRGRCNTILRMSFLAGCLACMVLLIYYLPEIVTGEGTLDDARGLCRDGACEALLEGGYWAPGEKIKEAKVVCRRATFCALARSGETPTRVGGKWVYAQGSDDGSTFEEVRDVCRDAHCTHVMRDAEKAQFITLEVGSALMQMFREEKEAMDAAIVEGDKLGNLAGGVFHKGPILQLIEGQLNGSSTTHIHWVVVDAVFRRGNDITLWSAAQIRDLLLWTGRWTEEKLRGSTENSALQRGWIVSNMLKLLELRISQPLATISTCQDSCEWNGICEDGGISAATFVCPFGTDCMVRMCQVWRGGGGGRGGLDGGDILFVFNHPDL